MLQIRPIAPSDNRRIAEIVLSVMKHYDADPQTTIAGDPTLHHMYENYREARAAYYVAEWQGQVVGGCGIRQLEGTEENICELQRMFILPEARGQGIGKALMEKCLAKAGNFGYAQVYLETLGEMREAQELYRKFGFRKIDQPMGDTGHCGCDVKMLKELQPLEKAVK
jgi:putative acetyltransferase